MYKYGKINYIVCIILVFSLTVGYSAFNKNMSVSDISSVVRVYADVRVTGVYVESKDNGGEVSSVDYNKKDIMSNIYLPNQNSTITYLVDVTVLGNQEMGIFDLNGLDEDLDYEVSDFNLKEDKICSGGQCTLGVTDYVKIKIRYADGKYNSSSNHIYDFVLNFDFRKFNTITYLGNLGDKIVGMKKESIIDGDKLIVSFDNSVSDINVYENDVALNDGYSYNNNVLIVNEVKGDIVIDEAISVDYNGMSVDYLGKSWYVIGYNSSEVKLLAKSGEFSNMASCMTSSSSSYCYWSSRTDSVDVRWSKSYVVDYLNNTWLSTVDSSKLIASEVCDDDYSNGGSHLNDGSNCTNGYVSSKVRFITESEFNEAKSVAGTNTSWLYGDTAYVAMGYPYTFETNFISTTGTFVAARTINGGGNYNADHSTPVRPVIIIPMSELRNISQKTVTYENIDEDNLIQKVNYGDSLVINFKNSYSNLQVYSDNVLLTSGYEFSNNKLVISSVTGNIKIKAVYNEYSVGDEVQYLGKSWYVLATDANETKLLAKTGEFSNMASCMTSSSSSYCYWVSRTDSVDVRWSKSYVVDYLNNTWLSTVDSSKLIASEVCDDDYSNGGSHLNDGSNCINGYVSSKVRFITESEFNEAKSLVGTNTSWLYGDSVYVAMGYPYTFETNFISTTGTFVAAQTLSWNGTYNADHSTPIRPVIVVQTNAL